MLSGLAERILLPYTVY